MRLMGNSNFVTIDHTDWLEENQLIWIERTDSCPIQGYITKVKGPFVVINGWGPMFFGHPSRNNPDKHYVKLICTNTGEERRVTYGSFLHETYYVISEDNDV